MRIAFTGPVWEWRGPAPHHFVSVPDAESAELEAAAAFVTYGWGMVPASVRIGATTWTTSLWPKDGGYVVPLKAAVRRAERIGLGDVVEVEVSLDV